MKYKWSKHEKERLKTVLRYFVEKLQKSEQFQRNKTWTAH